MTLALETPLITSLSSSIERGSATLAQASRVFLILFLAMLALQLVDLRSLNGVDVWIKPAKFFLSLGLHMATLAWAMALLDSGSIRRYRLNGAALLFVILAALEMAYMIFRASRGEASHFNRTSPYAEIAYGMMGMAALALMAITGWIGLALIRAGNPKAIAKVTGASFMAAAVLTSFVGMYLGSQPTHWIGGDQTDATGLPLFGWSTTGGDLRTAHFMAMHVMQLAPLLAIFQGSRAGWAGLGLGALATLALFTLAVAGLPLIPL